MNPEQLREALHWDRCVECGECLVQCRYLDLTRDQAIDEIRKINRGRATDTEVLQRCISCFACNAFCPHDAHPYERIHYLWHYRLEQQGVPRRASYLLPLSDPNFRKSLRYNRQERALLRRWDTPAPPGSTALFPGCNLCALPQLASGRLFAGLPVWGSWETCCGEMYYRMGALDTVAQIAERLVRFYAGRGLDELVFACPACFNMFRHILPEQFGARFDFRVTSFDRWLQRRLDRGALRLDHPLDGNVVVHDSCHGRVLGPDFMDRQRSLLRRCGLTVHETERNREHGLCCGIAAGANRYSLADLARTSLRAARALDRAPGDEVATYCTGCLLTLSGTRLLGPYRKPVNHTLEYLHAALGEPRPHRQSVRAAQMLAGISLHAGPQYLSRRRLFFR